MLSRFKNTIKQFKIKYSMQYQLTLECTRKFIPPPWYKKWDGGGGEWKHSPGFLIGCSISKRFCLQ